MAMVKASPNACVSQPSPRPLTSFHPPRHIPQRREPHRRQGLAEGAAAVAALAAEDQRGFRVQGEPPAAQFAEGQTFRALQPAQPPFVRLADVDDPRGWGGGQERPQLAGRYAAVGGARLRVVHGRIILPFVNPEDPDLSKTAPQGVKDWREAEEADLVGAARHDRAAFGALYDRHFDAIYNYIVRRVSDDAVAEDIAAEVWERALVAIERFEQRGVPFAAWLYRIAGNLVINHHRKAGLWRLVPFADRIAAARPFRQTEVRTAVEAAMANLSAADQEALALYYYGGQSPEEMAVILGCSVVAVHKRLHRARERLKGHLGGDPRAGSESA